MLSALWTARKVGMIMLSAIFTVYPFAHPKISFAVIIKKRAAEATRRKTLTSNAATHLLRHIGAKIKVAFLPK